MLLLCSLPPSYKDLRSLRDLLLSDNYLSVRTHAFIFTMHLRTLVSSTVYCTHPDSGSVKVHCLLLSISASSDTMCLEHLAVMPSLGCYTPLSSARLLHLLLQLGNLAKIYILCLKRCIPHGPHAACSSSW